MAKYRARALSVNSPSGMDFAAQPALSTHTQPNLRSLMEVLADSETEITLFIGAGVSVDAGYDTWASLLDALTQLIPKREYRDIAKNDREGYLRHAETIFRLIEPSGYEEDWEHLRRTLYSASVEPVAGPLSLILARLTHELNGRVRILTTNYDDVLEAAIEEIEGEGPEAYSLHSDRDHSGTLKERVSTLTGVTLWQKELERVRQNGGPTPVMHVHGMVRRRKPPLTPIILTESHFLRYGPRVRELVLDELRSRTVIFIGVSLDDPNVVGPLWDLKQSPSPDGHDDEDDNDEIEGKGHFALHVPGMKVGAESMDEARAYGLAKYRYLEEVLGVKPVHLKSYSQLYQLVNEMALCAQMGPSYLEEDTQVRYGQRFDSIMSNAWAAAAGEGYYSGDVKVKAEFEQRTKTTLMLAKLLDANSGKLGQLLRAPSEHVRSHMRFIRRDYDDLSQAQSEEEFGIFVWLRTPRESRDADYALRLAATSAYVNIAGQPSRGYAEIEEESTYLAAKAVYNGGVMLENLPTPATPGVERQLWKGGASWPLRLPGNGGLEDVTIGAVVLNSSFTVMPERDRKRPMSMLSAYARAGPDHMDLVRNALVDALVELLGADL